MVLSEIDIKWLRARNVTYLIGLIIKSTIIWHDNLHDIDI